MALASWFRRWTKPPLYISYSLLINHCIMHVVALANNNPLAPRRARDRDMHG
jgi:hypothetical protein